MARNTWNVVTCSPVGRLQDVGFFALQVSDRHGVARASDVHVLVRSCDITDLVSDERHRVVEEVGDEQASVLAGCGRIPSAGNRLDVESIRFEDERATDIRLPGHEPELVACVCVERISAKSLPDVVCSDQRQHFRCGPGLLDGGKLSALGDHPVRQRREATGESDQAARLERRELLVQLVWRQFRVDSERTIQDRLGLVALR